MGRDAIVFIIAAAFVISCGTAAVAISAYYGNVEFNRCLVESTDKCACHTIQSPSVASDCYAAKARTAP